MASRKQRTFWIAYFPTWPKPFEAFETKAEASAFVRKTSDDFFERFHERLRVGSVEGPFLVPEAEPT